MTQRNKSESDPPRTDGLDPADASVRARLASQHERELRLLTLPGKRLTATRSQSSEPNHRAAAPPGKPVVSAEIDWHARSAKIVAREQWLDRREQDQAEVQRELQRERTELGAHAAQLADRGVELDRRRRELRAVVRARGRRVRSLRDEFRARHMSNRAALAQQLEQIARERQALEESAAGVEHIREELEREGLQLHLRGEALEQNERALDGERAEVLGQASDLARLGQELEHGRAALQHREAALQQQRAQLSTRTQELDSLSQRQRADAERLVETKRGLAQRTYEAAQRKQDFERTVAEQEADLAQARGDLNHQQQALAESRAALADDRSALHARLEQLQAAEEELRQQRDELFDLRKQVEGREAEARQAAAALEMERLDAEQIRTQLQRTLADAAREREEFENGAKEARRAIAIEARRLSRSQRSVTSQSAAAPPRQWFARSVLLGGLSGAVTGVGVWFLSPTALESRAVLQLAPTVRPFAVAAAEHVAALGNPENADQILPEPGQASRWAALLRQDAVRIQPAPLVREIRMSGDARETPDLALILRAVAEGYLQCQQRTSTLRELPAAFSALDAIAQRITREREQTAIRMAEIEQRIAVDDGPQQAAAGRARLHALRQEQGELVHDLHSARVRLAALSEVTRPRGDVPASVLESALREDEVLQQDAGELAATVVGYRDELVHALEGAPAAMSHFLAKIPQLRDALRQQLASRPAADLARALEASLTEVDACLENSERWVTAWRSAVAHIPSGANADTAAALLAAYDTASDSARRLRRAGESLSQSLSKRWDALEALGGGATREVVTLNLVRSALNGFSSEVLRLGRDLGALDREQNFQLDALDRQVRSLQQRLVERPPAILARLQAEADELAAETRARQVDGLRQEVERLAVRREELAAALIEQMELSNVAERRSNERSTLELAQAGLRSQTARLDDELGRLKADLHAARRTVENERADELTILDVRTEERVEPQRAMRAAVAGLGGFGLAWLACLLMVARVPAAGGRRQAILARMAREADVETDEKPYEVAAAAAADS